MMSRRILFIGNFFSKHGYSRTASEELVPKLEDRGHNIFWTSAYEVKATRLADMVLSTIKAIPKVELAVIDVFSGPSFRWAQLISGILKLFRRPVVMVLRGGGLPNFSKTNQQRVAKLLKSADVIVSPSDFLKREMAGFRSDIKVIPNAIDLIDAGADEKVRGRADIAWLRAFHGIYNPSLAAKVLEIVLKTFPEATLTMYGPDKGDGSLQETKRIAENLGIIDRIVFAGQIPKTDVQRKLSGHSIFVNTTNIDNTPVSVIEAMAARCAIVSTDVGGIPDLLENEKTALLVPPNDVDAMAGAVMRILTEDGLAERLSTNARREAEKYSWDIVIPQWEQLFEKVMAESRGVPRS